jgi:hypothetical protein
VQFNGITEKHVMEKSDKKDKVQLRVVDLVRDEGILGNESNNEHLHPSLLAASRALKITANCLNKRTAQRNSLRDQVTALTMILTEVRDLIVDAKTKQLSAEALLKKSQNLPARIESALQMPTLDASGADKYPCTHGLFDNSCAKCYPIEVSYDPEAGTVITRLNQPTV